MSHFIYDDSINNKIKVLAITFIEKNYIFYLEKRNIINSINGNISYSYINIYYDLLKKERKDKVYQEHMDCLNFPPINLS